MDEYYYTMLFIRAVVGKIFTTHRNGSHKANLRNSMKDMRDSF